MTMTMPVDTARLRIARDLQEAEAALDDALLRQTELMGTMIDTRRATKSDPFLGQSALLRLAKSQQTLISAGGDLARVHGQMSEIQKEQAGYNDCPEEEGVLVSAPQGIAANAA
jgi:hypothetical protein